MLFLLLLSHICRCEFFCGLQVLLLLYHVVAFQFHFRQLLRLLLLVVSVDASIVVLVHTSVDASIATAFCLSFYHRIWLYWLRFWSDLSIAFASAAAFCLSFCCRIWLCCCWCIWSYTCDAFQFHLRQSSLLFLLAVSVDVTIAVSSSIYGLMFCLFRQLFMLLSIASDRMQLLVHHFLLVHFELRLELIMTIERIVLKCHDELW